MVNYRYVGSVLSKRDTIKLVLATSFFNNRVSSRCNARLGVYLADSLYGYFLVAIITISVWRIISCTASRMMI